MAQEQFVVLVICGHGGIVTEYTGRKKKRPLTDAADILKINPVFEISQAKLDIITFAAPTEVCTYTPEGLRNLRVNLGKLIKKNPQKYTSESGQIKFKTAVADVQKLGTLGVRYRSAEWAIDPNLTGAPNYTENHYIGKKYPEKKFTFEGDEGKFGVFLVHTNIADIPIMDYRPFLQEIQKSDDGLYLSDIIGYFNSAGVTKIYIMDATCSVIDDEHQIATDHILQVLKPRLKRTRKQLKAKMNRTRANRESPGPFSSYPEREIPGPFSSLPKRKSPILSSPVSDKSLSIHSPTEDTLSEVEVSPI